MKINWKVRMKNPLFWAEIVLAVLLPLTAYLGIAFEQITSWGVLLEMLLLAVRNPYVLALVVVSVYNAVIDPTTQGMGDSVQALGYQAPKESGGE